MKQQNPFGKFSSSVCVGHSLSHRAKTKTEQAETVQDILKLYQDEIDQLSRRSKSSETSFINLFKAVSECLDPIPVIEGLLTAQAQVWFIS
jgi:hypothetical protein